VHQQKCGLPLASKKRTNIAQFWRVTGSTRIPRVTPAVYPIGSVISVGAGDIPARADATAVHRRVGAGVPHAAIARAARVPSDSKSPVK
jgi:hypothetical protein